MGKRKYYLTLDTETATLPFANQIAKNATEKQRIAIAKPLVYDIGWVITNRKGEIVKQENYLVQETFFVPQVFNTAYYKEKRPIYMELYKQGKIKRATWDEIIDVLLFDLRAVDIALAYNATFDFKKAIPFTERYIKNLYTDKYTAWEAKQYKKCLAIASGNNDSENPDFLRPYFELRGEQFPIADLWAIACERLINIDKYRNYCLESGLLTNSAQYFKTSAETSYQYLGHQHDFEEAHTALEDALIEAQLAAKALRKGKIEPALKAFPFRELGTTIEYVRQKKPKYANIVIDALSEYLGNYCNKYGGYYTGLANKLESLEAFKAEYDKTHRHKNNILKD